MIRRLLPDTWKRAVRLVQRRIQDRGVPFAGEGTLVGEPVWLVSQVIRQTSLSENKIHNLGLGIQKIESIVLFPGEVFSFWRVLGNPSEARGYRRGRNIVHGTLQEAVGGGLCQLSGILYHAALKVGFPVLERFNHTVDIYREEERFTPLGADATVVYGYKDLRFRNQLTQPVQFVFALEKDRIGCGLRAREPVVMQEPVFVRREEGARCVVETWVGGERVARSVYG